MRPAGYAGEAMGFRLQLPLGLMTPSSGLGTDEGVARGDLTPTDILVRKR